MRLTIIRHGDPDYATDSLTLRGQAEAQALAEYLPALGLTHLYCSPLGRAKATCAPCAKKLNLPVTTLSWARELTGIYYQLEGFGRVAPFTVPGEVMYREAPTPKYEGWYNQRYFDDPRFLPLVKEMEQGADALLSAHGYLRQGPVYRIQNHTQDHVALFCHQGLGTTLIAYLLNIPYQAAWAGLWQPCTGITTFTLEERSTSIAVARMIGMGETPHIALSGLPRTECGLAKGVVG